MKHLACMICFFSFSIGPGYTEPTLSEKIEILILHCEAMKILGEDHPIYYQGRIDAYKEILFELSR